VLSLPARTGGSLFGKTVETVLAERPTRVIIHFDGRDGAGAPPSRRAEAAATARAGS
jgi:basic amino acid/polyamine antiporter, APA family